MAGGRPRGGSKLAALPIDHERDGREMWTRADLESMNDAFVSAVTRAIASGQERICDTVGAPCSPSTTPRLPAS
jgi:hypothetical protein